MPFHPFASYKTRRLQLTAREVATAHIIDPILSRAVLEKGTLPDWIRGEMEYQLRAYILGRQITSVEIPFYDSWFEMLKDELYHRFPRLSWFKKRWPAKISTSTLDAWQAFPEAVKPEFGNTLILETFSP
jgi:hypothetical protein